jgi:hypothetical protein
MTDRNAMPEDARSAADWLHHAAEMLRRIAHDATPGPWRWGDPAATIGVVERQRTTLERSPMNTRFPAVRRRDDDGEPASAYRCPPRPSIRPARPMLRSPRRAQRR